MPPDKHSAISLPRHPCQPKDTFLGDRETHLEKHLEKEGTYKRDSGNLSPIMLITLSECAITLLAYSIVPRHFLVVNTFLNTCCGSRVPGGGQISPIGIRKGVSLTNCLIGALVHWTYVLGLVQTSILNVGVNSQHSQQPAREQHPEGL